MGILIVDHSACQGADGLPGKRLEFDTVSCRHCQAIIRVVIQGVAKAYETKHSCDRCRGPICKWCAEHGVGCSPWEAKVEDAVRTGVWKPHLDFKYRILPHR